MKYRIAVTSLLLILGTGSSIVYAEQQAQPWLIKMGLAAQNLNYHGFFVYQHNSQLESMRIFHRVKRGVTTERLLSLNNAPREIIRNNDIIRCYFPDENSIVIEHHKANGSIFPRILPKNLERLKDNYIILLGAKERIADRASQNVIIKPRDKYRYGYHLWADINTGLLLKSDLVDSSGSVLEQFMFTHLEIGGHIKENDLKPRSSALGHKQYIKSENHAPMEKTKWQVATLPEGFVTSIHMKRVVPMHEELVEHMVLTDGLAAVSVFIEKKKGLDNIMSGANSMGAVNAFVKTMNGYQITVVGEVPAVTVKTIAQAVELSR